MSRGNGFAARFASICPRCSQDIRVGDRVVPHRGGYVHVGCFGGGDEGAIDPGLAAVACLALMLFAAYARWLWVMFR